MRDLEVWLWVVVVQLEVQLVLPEQRRNLGLRQLRVVVHDRVRAAARACRKYFKLNIKNILSTNRKDSHLFYVSTPPTASPPDPLVAE